MDTKIVAMTVRKEKLFGLRKAFQEVAGLSLERFVLANLSLIYDVFSDINKEEFLLVTNYLLQRDQADEMNVFLYFLALFRDIPAVKAALNDPDAPLVLIERLLMFSSIFFYSEDLSRGVFRDVVDILEPERLLDVVLGSAVLQRDLRLVFSVLMTFDTRRIDAFFTRTQNSREIALGFVALPENMIKDLLLHNVVLFDYLRSILAAYVDEEQLNDFNLRFSQEIALTKMVNKYVDLYRQLEHDLADDTDMHVALLLQVLGRLGGDSVHLFFERCGAQGVVISDTEMLLVKAAFDSPVLSRQLSSLRHKHIPGIERLDAPDEDAHVQVF